MRCSLKALVVAILMICATRCAQLDAGVPVIWDGSAGVVGTYHAPPDFLRWEEGNWTKDGTPGQTAVATMGDATGGRGGLDIIIGGGAKVFHDQNDDTDDVAQGGTGLGLGDFKPRMDLNGPGSLTVKEGATLWLDAHTDEDGRWARMNINVNLDNGVFRTTRTPEFCPPSECSVSGGRVIFGYQNELLPNTKIDINLTNGGRMETHGKVIFGNPDFHEEPDEPHTGHNPGIEVAMTINGGTLDLTGGNAYQDFFGLVDGELIFIYEYYGGVGPKNEKYSINFTGPGSIIVDTGIFVGEQDSAGVYAPHHELDPASVPDLYTPLTYQDLWSLGILQANGLSGKTGATFADFFTTTGTPGMPDYTLTSLLAPPGLDGDYNEDGRVDAADYVVWRKSGAAGGYDTWRTNFGRTQGAEASLVLSEAVPEPSSIACGLLALATLYLGRPRVRFE
ncbi:MAG TPA: hypothetical protein VGK58_08995 [Lacipirellulaceae bacterium]